jgi:hypothetical protein
MINGTEASSNYINYEATNPQNKANFRIHYFDEKLENLSSILKQVHTHIDKLERQIILVNQKMSQNLFKLEIIHGVSIDVIRQTPPTISTTNRAIEIGTNFCLSLGIVSTLLEVFKLDLSITSIFSLLQLLLVLIFSYGIVFAVKDSIVKQITTTENIMPYRKINPDNQDKNFNPQVKQNSQVKSETKPELQTQSLLWIFNDRQALINCGILMFLDFCFSVPGVWLSLPSNVDPLVRCSAIIAVFLFSYLNISNSLVMASTKILRDLKRRQTIQIIAGESESEILLLVERAYKLDLTLLTLEDKHEKLLDRADELEGQIADLEEERLDIIRDLGSSNE